MCFDVAIHCVAVRSIQRAHHLAHEVPDYFRSLSVSFSTAKPVWTTWALLLCTTAAWVVNLSAVKILTSTFSLLTLSSVRMVMGVATLTLLCCCATARSRRSAPVRSRVCCCAAS